MRGRTTPTLPAMAAILQKSIVIGLIGPVLSYLGRD
jgi:hypothetical protein